jgi:RNA polymerase sigma-70 factor (ECF subfamily)
MKVVCNNTGEEKTSRENSVISPDNLPEISKLVNRAAQGDIEAFGQLYTIFLDRIYRYVLYQVRDKMTAEDITEEVFLKAWKAIKTCKGKGKTFSSWIYRIAHNHIINTRRNLNKLSSIEVEKLSSLNEPDLVFEMNSEQHEIMESIAELPPNQAQVITLKFIEGFDNREIGKILGKSEGAVRITQLRALTALRQKIGGGKYGTRCGIS